MAGMSTKNRGGHVPIRQNPIGPGLIGQNARGATVALALFWLWAAACSSAPAPVPPLQPRPVVELERWEARDGDRLLGNLVEFEIQDPAAPVRFYQIEDAAGRIVGSATASRRFSRRVPFQDEEQDVGVWSLASGVARLFELPAGRTVKLTAIPVEADARKR